MREHQYFVYMMANENNKVLYTGVTNNLSARIYQHKHKQDSRCFTVKYNCVKLVWFDETNSVAEAIAYEKKLKGGPRKNKERLIRKINSEWKDLSLDWR